MEQYQPLYLKYRPQKLSEVIGQDVVTKTLTNAILYNKIVHAYLFCGPRGTGKTSTARILAKSLNCEKGTTTEPCDKCTNCLSIINGNSLDVIEIDAASHRKVEDAEDLINRVNLGTYGSRFKIYIIDEVHMLTDHAFNALLKTLEEPPKNVIFVLATTEDYKVISTIISRCQKLDFKPVVHDELVKRITEIARNEKINIDQTVFNFISKRSLGCLRDAISLLDQISVLQEENKSINPKEVFELFGSVDRASLFKLTEAILSFDVKNSIDLAEELVKSGKDIGELFKSLIELFIDLGKAKIDSGSRNELKAELSNNLEILDKVEKSHLLKIIDRLHEGQSKLRFALSQELQFMVEIMSLLDKDFLVSMSELVERVKRLENGEGARERIGEGARGRGSEGARENKQDLKTSEPQDYSSTEAQEHRGTESTSLDLTWNKIVSAIDSNPTRTLLTQSGSYLLNLNSELIEIGISKDMFLPRLEKDEKKKEMILKVVNSVSGIEPKQVKFKVLPRSLEVPKSGSPEVRTSDTVASEPQDLPPKASAKDGPDSGGQDEFTRSIKELLGAKEID